MLSVLTAIIGCQVKRICRGFRNADDRRPKLEKLLVVLITGRLCMGTFTLRVRALSVFCPIGAIRRAASREKNAFYCHHRKNYYPCPSVETLKGRKAMKGPFDDHVWQLKHTHGTPFLMLVTMVTTPWQSHALRTRGPCIPIGNFPGLVTSRQSLSLSTRLLRLVSGQSKQGQRTVHVGI